jgi:hypothetical protein
VTAPVPFQRPVTTGQPTAHDRTRPDALPAHEAARRLGITTEAIRKRIARGSLEGWRRGRRWFVVIPDVTGPEDETPRPDATAHPAPAVRSRPDTPPDATAHDRTPNESQPDQGTDGGELALLREVVGVLRDELEARRREVQQLHTLLAQAQARIGALPAPTEPSGPLEDASPLADPDPVPPAADRRPWWRFW